jgi:serine/threonine protein kinase HipA of HipAB toxin-antitoxin module
MKKFLAENKLGPYAKARLNEDIGGDIGDAEAEKEMDFLAEKEKFLTKGDNEVITRISDAIQTIEASLEQLISDPTKNVRNLAKYAMEALDDIKKITEN